MDTTPHFTQKAEGSTNMSVTDVLLIAVAISITPPGAMVLVIIIIRNRVKRLEEEEKKLAEAETEAETALNEAIVERVVEQLPIGYRVDYNVAPPQDESYLASSALQIMTLKERIVTLNAILSNDGTFVTISAPDGVVSTVPVVFDTDDPGSYSLDQPTIIRLTWAIQQITAYTDR